MDEDGPRDGRGDYSPEAQEADDHGKPVGRSRRESPDRAVIDTGPHVAYDEDLADRIRELLADEPELTEKRMFGGLAFLVAGNMAVGASGQGGLLARVEPEEGAALMRAHGVAPMEMQGREMAGWLRVQSSALGAKAELETWVRRSVAYARSLPPKG
jgi:TfoX/Sxy family transcriptional regulator of competence genes